MLTGYRRLAVRRKALINIEGSGAIRGIIMSQKGQLVEVANAEMLEPGLNPTPMDGTVLVERSRILFIQLLEG